MIRKIPHRLDATKLLVAKGAIKRISRMKEEKDKKSQDGKLKTISSILPNYRFYR